MRGMFAAFIVCVCFGASQVRPLPPTLAELVHAERSFARLSVEKGVREAFTTFFADDGIAFLPRPVNGKEAYGALPVPAGQPERTLDWAPVYGDISEAGDLGYSTGPAVNSDNTDQKRPARHSLFFSIWRKAREGEWRVALDLGVPLERAHVPLDSPYVRAPQWKAMVPKDEDHTSSLLKADRDFFEAAGSGGAWQRILHGEARVYRVERMPMSGKEWLATKPEPLTGRPIKAEAARSGDLGYTYGSYQQVKEKGFYARAWKRDTAGRWLIVFDVARPVPEELKK